MSALVSDGGHGAEPSHDADNDRDTTSTATTTTATSTSTRFRSPKNQAFLTFSKSSRESGRAGKRGGGRKKTVLRQSNLLEYGHLSKDTSTTRSARSLGRAKESRQSVQQQLSSFTSPAFDPRETTLTATPRAALPLSPSSPPASPQTPPRPTRDYAEIMSALKFHCTLRTPEEVSRRMVCCDDADNIGGAKFYPCLPSNDPTRSLGMHTRCLVSCTLWVRRDALSQPSGFVRASEVPP